MINRKKKEFITLTCLYALSVLLGVLYYINSPVQSGSDALAVIDSLLYILAGFIVITAAALLLSKFRKVDAFFGFFEKKIQPIRQNKNRLLITAAVIAAVFALSHATELAVSNLIFSSRFIWQRFLFIAVLLFSASAIYVYRGKPEKTFLCLSLIIGALFSVTTPISYSSWDEIEHYPWAIEQSSVNRAYFTKADIDIRSILQDDYYDRDTRVSRLNEKNEENTIFSGFLFRSFTRIYSSIGHIPSGTAIFLGRSLGLSWAAVFIMGRLGNLIAYSMVMYFAVKRVKYGKYIIAVIGLIPTVLFVASNYSYDSWIIAWLMLGTSYFLRELQEPDEKVKYTNLAVMLIAFFVGLGPKAVYFPIMFMLFFIGRSKFYDDRHCRNYRIILSASIAFVIASFMLPFLVSSGDYSDLRGGDGIDSVAQIAWIFTNPLEYADILFKFLLKYFSFPKAADYLTLYGHLGGFLSLYIYMIAFITAVVFTDKNERFETINNKLRAVTLASCLITVVLFTTALYITINIVGTNNILWVQPRYLLPLIGPALLIVRSGGITNKINENCYGGVVFGFSALFLLSSFWVMCISQYH